MKKRIAVAMLLLALLLAVAFYAEKPEPNINAKHHPNLAAAQQLSIQAYDKIVEAQKANEWDLGGHADKAKALLEQVCSELKLAAENSNKHKGK
jgi:hypothetical protein